MNTSYSGFKEIFIGLILVWALPAFYNFFASVCLTTVFKVALAVRNAPDQNAHLQQLLLHQAQQHSNIDYHLP